MSRYYKIENRLAKLEKWLTLCSKLTSDNRKITLNEDLGLVNDVSDFIDKIRLLDGEMILLKEQKGTYGFPYQVILDDFHWFIKISLYDTFVKVSKLDYPKHYDKLEISEKVEFHKKIIQHKKISTNTEHYVHALLTKLVKNKWNPHICLLYGATELYDSKHEILFEMLIKRYKKSEKESLLNVGKVLMTEWCNLGELGKVINTNKYHWTKETWQVILFQLLSMLALIHEKYPSFRHNDLSLSNVLVISSRSDKLDENETPGYYKYTIFEKTYCIPDVGFTVLLSDFDFCTIDELDISNEKIENEYTKKFGITSYMNQSFDCHYMLNWLDLYILKLNKIDLHNSNLVGLKRFYDSVLDKEYKGNNNVNLKYSRLRSGKKVLNKLIPRNIIETNEYFEKFRNHEEWTKDIVLIEEYNKPDSVQPNITCRV